MTCRSIVMLLDNHYAPDPRVELESKLLMTEGEFRVRVVAWDRGSNPAGNVDIEYGRHLESIIRLGVVAPPGGRALSVLRAARFAARVWRNADFTIRDADLLVVHDVYLLPYAVLFSFLLRRPLIYDAHEEFAAMEATRYPRSVLAFVTRVETALARRAKAVIVPGQSRVSRWSRVGIYPVVLPNIGQFENYADNRKPTWDIVYCGSLTPQRRTDLLVEVARAHPEVRIAVAGRGREAESLRQAGQELPNFDFLGWRDNPDSILAQGRAIYYGLDPDHPYSEKACPNTLYQALRLGKPLIYFCGGEPDELARNFNIGIKVAPNARAIWAALSELREWNCSNADVAWAAVLEASAVSHEEYLTALRSALASRCPRLDP
jgi:glycosyltransferase involved in cell wall biosynthesis